MGLVDDFLLLPNWLKYVVFIAILLGTTIQIPIVGISIGSAVFAPFFNFVFSGLGIGISYKEFVILVLVIFGAMFVLSFRNGG